MNFKKLVVMLCIGSHLLATSSIASAASKNPFKKWNHIFKPIIAPINSMPLPPLPDLPPVLKNPIIPIPDLGSWLDKRFVPGNLNSPSSVLKAIGSTPSFLRGTGLTLTSGQFEVDDVLFELTSKNLNLTKLELIGVLTNIFRVLERNNSLDLLRVWEPDWLERLEERVSPLIAESGVPLLPALRMHRGEINNAVKDAESWVWKLAKQVSAMTEEIANDLIKPMAHDLTGEFRSI